MKPRTAAAVVFMLPFLWLAPGQEARGQALISSGSISGLQFWDRTGTGTGFLFDPVSGKLDIKANSVAVASITAGGVFYGDGSMLRNVSGGVPTGGIMFFNLATCPAGWTELTTARGRYLVGLPASGTLTGTDGTALTNLEDRPVGQHNHGITDPGHTHTNNGTTINATGSNTAPGGPVFGPETINSAVTGITVNNAGSVAGTPAPYIQLLVCSKN